VGERAEGSGELARLAARLRPSVQQVVRRRDGNRCQVAGCEWTGPVAVVETAELVGERRAEKAGAEDLVCACPGHVRGAIRETGPLERRNGRLALRAEAERPPGVGRGPPITGAEPLDIFVAEVVGRTEATWHPDWAGIEEAVC